VTPVADARVDAIRPHVTRQVWALLELLRITGMRSGETVIMRSVDIDRSGDVWAYIPSRHKAELHGRKRTIYLGPRARAVIEPWLGGDPSAYLFRPKDEVSEALADRRRKRASPMTPSQRARKRSARPGRTPGERYTPATLGRAVARGCDRAFPHPALDGIGAKDLTPNQSAELRTWRKSHRWHPHQLRHGAATRLRRAFGLDTARVVLSHSSATVTEIYAEVDSRKAEDVMREIG
jgi:integrase